MFGFLKTIVDAVLDAVGMGGGPWGPSAREGARRIDAEAKAVSDETAAGRAKGTDGGGGDPAP